MTFEEQFEALEAVLAKLEGGDLALEDSLKEYERGVKALIACREALDKAEQRIEELTPPSGLEVEGGEE